MLVEAVSEVRVILEHDIPMLPAPNAAVGDAKMARRRTVQRPTVIEGVREGMLMGFDPGLKKGTFSLNYGARAARHRCTFRRRMFQRLAPLSVNRAWQLKDLPGKWEHLWSP